MPIIPSLTVALATYHPMRPFPGEDRPGGHFAGWIESVSRLEIANEILILERLDKGNFAYGTGIPKHIDPSCFPLTLAEPDLSMGPPLLADPRCRIIYEPNDPPWIDCTRQPMQELAKNDWVLFLDDDERLSEGMIRWINGLAQVDPLPDKDWSVVRFARDDYIRYRNLWRHIPANGDDPQIRLVDRRRVTWPGTPHNLPVVDGLIVDVRGIDTHILHYREYEKIVKRTAQTDALFVGSPNLIRMQDDYVRRVEAMLGVRPDGPGKG